jgi:hypothetical protein
VREDLLRLAQIRLDEGGAALRVPVIRALACVSTIGSLST